MNNIELKKKLNDDNTLMLIIYTHITLYKKQLNKLLTVNQIKILLSAFIYKNPDIDNKYKNKDVSPYITIYKEDEFYYHFPRGSLHIIINLLKEFNITFSFINNTYTSLLVKNNVFLFLIKKRKTWEYYDYQKQIINKSINFLDNNKISNLLIESPAGSGKTIIGCSIIEYFKNPTIILVNSIDILQQWKHTLIDKFMVSKQIIGLFYDKYKELNLITIATVQSLYRYLKNKKNTTMFLNNFFLVLLDEAHHVPAHTFNDVLTLFNSNHIVGLTATAFREDGLNFLLPMYLGETKFTVKENDLIKYKKIMNPTVDIYFFKYNNIFLKDISYNNLLKELMFFSERNEFIINNIIKDWKNSQSILVITPRIKHGELLYDKLNQQVSGRVCLITGKTAKQKRNSLLNDMINRKKDILIAAQIADEGLDIPILSSIHFVLPFKKRRLLIQRIGRIRRLHKDKQFSKIVDYVDRNISLAYEHYLQRQFFYLKNKFIFKTQDVFLSNTSKNNK